SLCDGEGGDGKVGPLFNFRETLTGYKIRGFFVSIIVCVLPSGAIDFPPSCLKDHISLCVKLLSAECPGEGSLLILAGRGEHGQKAADDHVVDPAFVAAHVLQLNELFCGDDGMVV